MQHFIFLEIRAKRMSTPHHVKLFGHELTRRAPLNSVEKLATVLSDAPVDLNPHQIEAALFAFRFLLSQGAILANEVGFGKILRINVYTYLR